MTVEHGCPRAQLCFSCAYFCVRLGPIEPAFCKTRYSTAISYMIARLIECGVFSIQASILYTILLSPNNSVECEIESLIQFLHRFDAATSRLCSKCRWDGTSKVRAWTLAGAIKKSKDLLVRQGPEAWLRHRLPMLPISSKQSPCWPCNLAV